jgi:hypothetical protein
MCRYHLTYPSEGASPEQDDWDVDWDEHLDESWDLEELCIGAEVNDAEITEENVPSQVELVKAIRMMNDGRYETHCEECEPLFVPTRKSTPFCKCTVHSHFVRRWRCIPCILVEEATLITSQQKYTVELIRCRNQSGWLYYKVGAAP